MEEEREGEREIEREGDTEREKAQGLRVLAALPNDTV